MLLTKKYFSLLGSVTFALALTGCSTDIAAPISHISRRPTPLSFGMHVTPEQDENPIDPPERFVGYHVAVDFEVTAEELDQEVPVYAVCSGNVTLSGFAEGYGGVLVQLCDLDGEPVTVIYGHLTIEGLPKRGSSLKAGQKFATLGAARSHDTDNNRKHLHFGIRRGAVSDIRGYVQTEREVNQYIDPRSLLPGFTLDTLGLPMMPYWKTSSGSVSVPARPQ